MHIGNIHFGDNVDIHPTATFNFVTFAGDNKISKECHLFGGENHQLKIGKGTKINMYTLVDGATAKITIGEHVGIAQQNVIVSDWQLAPGSKLARLFPKSAAPITIGSGTCTGSSCVIAPGVTIGECCVIATNSYVAEDVPSYSVYGGNPARLIKKIDPKELG